MNKLRIEQRRLDLLSWVLGCGWLALALVVGAAYVQELASLTPKVAALLYPIYIAAWVVTIILVWKGLSRLFFACFDACPEQIAQPARTESRSVSDFLKKTSVVFEGLPDQVAHLAYGGVAHPAVAPALVIVAITSGSFQLPAEEPHLGSGTKVSIQLDQTTPPSVELIVDADNTATSPTVMSTL